MEPSEPWTISDIPTFSVQWKSTVWLLMRNLRHLTHNGNTFSTSFKLSTGCQLHLLSQYSKFGWIWGTALIPHVTKENFNWFKTSPSRLWSSQCKKPSAISLKTPPRREENQQPTGLDHTKRLVKDTSPRWKNAQSHIGLVSWGKLTGNLHISW